MLVMSKKALSIAAATLFALGVGVVMMAAGVFWIRKIVNAVGL